MKIKNIKVISLSLIMTILMSGCSLQKLKKETIIESQKTVSISNNTTDNIISSSEEEKATANSINNDINTSRTVETTNKVTAIKKASITISAIGDCTIGTDINRYYENSLDEYYDKYGSSYFFKNVENIFSKDDLTIANLECALTDNSSHDDKKYVYGGKLEYAGILKKANIEVVSLANNHSYDYLDDGYNDTLETLNSYNIDYCHKDIISYKIINDIKIAIISVKEGYGKEIIKNCIDEAIRNNTDLQIVCIHWGKNYQSNYNYNQETLGHYIVDCGADLILGSHPHILQGIETYKGVNIVYSLGNFCYGGKKHLDDENDTMIYQQIFMIENNEITNSEANIIPCYMSSSFPKNDYQPMEVKEKEEINRIKKKILNLSNNFKY